MALDPQHHAHITAKTRYFPIKSLTDMHAVQAEPHPPAVVAASPALPSRHPIPSPHGTAKHVHSSDDLIRS